ncbi:hypothetical protein U1Q18_037402 [Sarracenia purpurea var. burkii]
MFSFFFNSPWAIRCASTALEQHRVEERAGPTPLGLVLRSESVLYRAFKFQSFSARPKKTSQFIVQWFYEPLWVDFPIIDPHGGVAIVELVPFGDLAIHRVGWNSSPISLCSTARLGGFPKSLLGFEGRGIPKNDLQLPCL